MNTISFDPVAYRKRIYNYIKERKASEGWYRKHAVKAANVLSFCMDYYKNPAMFELREHETEFWTWGYTVISAEKSITGKMVTYFGDKEEEE